MQTLSELRWVCLSKKFLIHLKLCVSCCREYFEPILDDIGTSETGVAIGHSRSVSLYLTLAHWRLDESEEVRAPQGEDELVGCSGLQWIHLPAVADCVVSSRCYCLWGRALHRLSGLPKYKPESLMHGSVRRLLTRDKVR
ncbi:hypothetical protein EVAR_29955_1 [Eumeta japonica]|uniref:Uncharacterized protein n=1 Tax=Eumeta variegata TaxID=151549 RepID=A0A4C1VIM9_EUMVA|nr:hypothetical protein EVAR_29955_1 [Eumeta japonica]